MPAAAPTHDPMTSPVLVPAGTWDGTGWIDMDLYDSIQVTFKIASLATAPTALSVQVEATNSTNATPAASEIVEVTPRYAITPAAANLSVDYSVSLCRGNYGDHARVRIRVSPTGQDVNVSYIVSRTTLT